ncbi:MAG: alpha/beta hydrolase [Alphaproteobacteria bacterium]
MLLRALVLVAVLATLADTASAPPFPAVADFAAPGPFAPVGHQEGPGCTIFRPAALDEGGRRHPVILWGNGTGSQPANYAGLLSHWARQGFVVAAANTGQAGSGAEMLACLTFLEQRNGAAGNPYSDKLDLAHVGAAGHSQGGRGAIMAGRDPRVSATAPFMPAGARQGPGGPMLLLSGSIDTLAPPDTQQRPLFEAASGPVFWATAEGAGHMAPGGDGGPFRAISTAWFRWRLMGDASAARWFEGEACTVCTAPGWRVQRR